MMVSKGSRWLATTVVVALLLFGCSRGSGEGGSAGGSDEGGPTSTSEIDRGDPGSTGPTSDREPEPPAPTLTWSPCYGGECAEIEVPLDHDDPDGARIGIALIRTSVADPDRRIGSLVLNPGGPGGSGVAMARYLQLPEPVTERFDVVGFDPRGVGDSTPLDCHRHLQGIYDADPTVDSAAERRAFLEVSRAFVDECEDEHGDLLPHLGTVSVARDLDLIRRALGDEQLNYLGFSYGTVIGQQYARLFPERVRAMVLDGVAGPDQQGLEGAVRQAMAFERAIDRFIARCDEHRCVDDDTATVVDEVIARTEAEPIPSSGGERPATRGIVNLAIDRGLYAEWLWPELAGALLDARNGDGAGLVRLADDYLGRTDDGYSGGFEVYFAVSCIDAVWPDDPDVIMERAAEVGDEAPRTGEGIVNDYVRCALWPADPVPIEPIPSDLDGLAPILLVSTTGDPATPHASAEALSRSIPNARLLTHRGEGHTVVAGGVPCVDDAVVDYLLTAEVPEDDLVC